MDQALRKQWPIVEQDQRISEAVSRDQSRLRSFIRRRVADPGDAEDILQDVFYELSGSVPDDEDSRAGHGLVISGRPKPDHRPVSQKEPGGVTKRTGKGRGRW